VLASTTGGEVRFTGLISSLLNADAGESTVASDALITTPVPGKPVILSTAQG